MFVNTNGTCSVCHVSCATCSNDTSCITCVENYYKNPLFPNFCVTCEIEYCTECTESNECATCNNGYVNVEGTCFACSDVNPGCTSCKYDPTTKKGNCSTCANSYYLNDKLLCAPCMANCLSCNSSFCFTCSYGYINHNDSGTCTPGLPNCFYRAGSNVCSSCNRGYYLNGSVCLPC